MRIYQIISYRNRAIGDSVTAYLRKAGHTVFVPHEHPQLRDGCSAQEIFDRNTYALQTAERVVALFDGYYGKDFTAEVGMAYAWGRKIIGFGNGDSKDLMSVVAVTSWVRDVDELPKALIG